MTQPKHTHPLGYVQHTAKQLKDYWFLILLAVWQWDHLTTTWRVVAVLAMVTWLLIWPLLKWLTLTYQLTATAIVVNSGIFVRHHRHIPYSRLQTVQRKQWFYLRPFHLETLQIETASHQDGEPEVQLPAVPLTVADTLERYRRASYHPLSPDAPAPQPATTTPASNNGLGAVQQRYVTNRHTLLLFALTSTGIIPLLLVLLAIYGKLPHKWVDLLVADAQHFALPLLIGGAVALLIIAWLGALIWVLIRYYRFTLTRTPDQLQIAKGLFQRNTITAPLNRVQAVRTKQNILRQWLHLQTVQVLLASKAATDDDDHDLVILPAIAQQQLYSTLHPFIDWVPGVVPQLEHLIVPQHARWLLSRNAVLVVALPVVLLGWLVRPWGWLGLLLIPFAILQGQFAAHNTGGSLLTHQLLVLQTGHFWTRETFFVPREQIQSLQLNWSVWMVKRQLAHLTVNVRHGNHNQAIELRYISAKQAQNIYDWYQGQ
ncbi:PH domain-containing protein [Levilactobacillus spicheri]|uniref:Membrane protein n=2 Tax=Levilactobacillus spicheri TaxID=216463 RepID=A0ABQ0WQV8_9LACO|nr:PH domain-containing protein [Levilactobacillus spicheri]KRL47618.1 hypothetical protein FD37_GL001877 [Levilactobacillus spicheri DSM 15429]GEO67197.1 membrane protein [Levilactobacillus spicheri]